MADEPGDVGVGGFGELRIPAELRHVHAAGSSREAAGMARENRCRRLGSRLHRFSGDVGHAAALSGMALHRRGAKMLREDAVGPLDVRVEPTEEHCQHLPGARSFPPRTRLRTSRSAAARSGAR